MLRLGKASALSHSCRSVAVCMWHPKDVAYLDPNARAVDRVQAQEVSGLRETLVLTSLHGKYYCYVVSVRCHESSRCHHLDAVCGHPSHQMPHKGMQYHNFVWCSVCWQTPSRYIRLFALGQGTPAAKCILTKQACCLISVRHAITSLMVQHTLQHFCRQKQTGTAD